MKNYQHQPLRKPFGWKGQEASLVIQLERHLDAIYRRLGDIELNVRSIKEDIEILSATKAGNSIIGIVIDGDTAAQNVAAGDYVVVQNSTISGITDGAYTAGSNVASGVAFTSSDLTEVTNGIANSLNAEI